MPRYFVTLEYMLPMFCEIEVDAADETEARQKAYEREAEGIGEWTEDADGCSKVKVVDINTLPAEDRD